MNKSWYKKWYRLEYREELIDITLNKLIIEPVLLLKLLDDPQGLHAALKGFSSETINELTEELAQAMPIELRHQFYDDLWWSQTQENEVPFSFILWDYLTVVSKHINT